MSMAVATTLGLATAHADLLQNQTVNGSAQQLNAAGFGNINGATMSIGLNESGIPNFAGQISPGSNLPNGNPNLPAANFVVLAGNNITDHASETSGVIVSTIPGQQGLAPAATIAVANNSDTIFNGPVAAGGNSNIGSANLLSLFQRLRTPVINMSYGSLSANPKGTFANNGMTSLSPFVDWGIQTYNTVAVVAGNENGTAQSPSDAFNVINVAASGVRNGNVLNYNQVDYSIADNYNFSNTTADGRVKTDIVAPGGDPGAANPPGGTFQNPPAPNYDLFQTTAGGQYELAGSVLARDTNGVMRQLPVYNNDVFNGLNPVKAPAVCSTASAFMASNWSQALAPTPNPNFPTPNPGGFANDDVVVDRAICGTSFAAPLVSGAAAMLDQEFQIMTNSNLAFLNHLADEALILNGANKGGLTSINAAGNVNPWTRAPVVAAAGTRTVATPSGNTGPVAIQPGLDPLLGTGQLNVVNSLVNLKAGQQGPGWVQPIGWDVETIQADTNNGGTVVPNSIKPSDNPLPGDPTKYAYGYDFGTGGGPFQATLDWDMPVSITANGTPGGNWQAGGGGTDSSTLTDGKLSDFDLYLFQNVDGYYNLIDSSTSNVDNVEHLYMPDLASGSYELDVVDVNNAQATPYGLAWNALVPEPTSLGLLMVPALFMLRRRRI
jgi:hypothetical protein